MGFAVAEDQEFALPPLEERPLVTFALFAYNQEKYIREAVEGAFAQTYEPLEIILSDDCSTDRTFEIIESCANHYEGPHSVKKLKNDINSGILNHVLKVAKQSRGKYIIVAAGDDISLPERTSILVQILMQSGAGAVSGSYIEIADDSSIIGRKIYTLDDFRDPLKKFPWTRIQGATACYLKEILIEFPIPDQKVQLEDYALSILLYKLGWHVGVTEKPLVKHRIHDTNTSLKNIVSKRQPSKAAELKRAQFAGLVAATLQYVLSTPALSDVKDSKDAKLQRDLKSLAAYKAHFQNWINGNLINRLQILISSFQWGETRGALLRLLGLQFYLFLTENKLIIKNSKKGHANKTGTT